MISFLPYVAILLSLIILGLLIYKLICIFLTQWRYGVPFVRTASEGIAGLVEHIDIQRGQTFCDIGCGDGIVMARLLDRYPDIYTIGYELDPTIVALSAPYQHIYGDRFVIHTQDYFTGDFGVADVIYMYILPRLLPRLRDMICTQCKPGTRVYTYTFAINHVTPVNQRTIHVANKKDAVLYMYTVT